ncbi:MAG: hypothetical protein O7D30_04340, partial [Rickettsia endosymbiont of Ixodes persulcatus]|nr:hypothetical protein [Rickettsia endosymbiont of Ixodes persulcatus]
LLDSSHVILTANVADMYKGCGACYKGRSSTVQSSLKLQVVFDYLNQSLETVDITGGMQIGKTEEKIAIAINLKRKCFNYDNI